MAEHDQQDQSFTGNPPATITKRDRAKFLTQEVKQSVKELLHHDGEQQTTTNDELFEDAAFDPQRVLEPEQAPKASFRHRLSIGAKSVVGAVKNPKAASRNNYTRHAAAKIANHPHDLGTAYDDELLDAHDALSRATEQPDVSSQANIVGDASATKVQEIDDAQSRLQRAEQQREDLKSGWILGRHVLRAKVVRPMVSKPDRAQFLVESDQPGRPPHLQWPRYLGHLVLWYTNPYTAHRIDDFEEPPFDLRELALTVERIAAISTPWQSYFTKVRDVYRWEDPRRTTQIMLGYWVLWYFQQIASFGIGFIIYITIRNKLYPSAVEAVRDRVQRSRDQSQKVRAWGELIQKHGQNDWIEPMLDEMGPLLQMQMGDLTLFLERLQNFYRWERPQQTWLTLALFLCGLLFSLLASMEIFIRVVGFGAGCYFFYSFPIATNYPKYRHIVSPLCWMFWGIPDTAELAISQLQEKTIERDETRLASLQNEGQAVDFSHNASAPNGALSPPLPNGAGLNGHATPPQAFAHPTPTIQQIRASDIITFKTILLPAHTPAHLTLTRTHIILQPTNQSPLSHPYTSLLEIRKVEINTDSNQNSSSADTNSFSRSTHIATWLEKSANVQLLPDGLGFVFLKDDTESSDHLGNLQDQQVTDKTREHAINKHEPAPEESHGPDRGPLPNILSLPHNTPESGPQQNSPNPATNTTAPSKTEITLILNKTDRDKIFTVILGWSGLDWQPLYSMNRQNRLGRRRTKGEGNRNLDDAIKKGLS